MASPSLPAFVAASLLLAVSPGPGVLYIVGRTLAHGRAAGLASVAGVAAGNLLNAVGSALGLALLFAGSGAAFAGVRLLGAAYLVWLGVGMLRSTPTGRPGTTDPGPAKPLRRLCTDGLFVAAFNPKTALFFAAFVPQFVDPAAPTLAQTLRLGGIFVGIAATSDAAYALLAHAIAARLVRPGSGGRLARQTGGVSLIGLGLLAAASSAGPGLSGLRRTA